MSLHWISPGYEFPTLAGGIWIQSANNSPHNPPGYIIANVASGPGSSAQGVWTTAIANAANAGWTVLGYVNTSNAGTMISAGTIESDVDKWFSFYGLVNIWFDQCTGLVGDLANYTALTAYVRVTHGAGISMMNTGSVPTSGYLSPSVCDVMGVFENTEALYNTPGAPGVQTGTGIAHIMHDSVSVRQMSLDLRTAMALGANYVFVTDKSSYTTPPTFFAQENYLIGQSALPQTWIGNAGNMAREGGRQLYIGAFS